MYESIWSGIFLIRARFEVFYGKQTIAKLLLQTVWMQLNRNILGKVSKCVWISQAMLNNSLKNVEILFLKYPKSNIWGVKIKGIGF